MNNLPHNSRITIIGAGAAGCFCAIELKRLRPDLYVTILEAGTKPLAKVAVTGGGRCNLTNSFDGISQLDRVYPRGFRLIRRAFNGFSPEDTRNWWENEGVRLVVQDDGCIFPESQDAMQIVSTLANLMQKHGVQLRCGCKAAKIERDNTGFTVTTTGGAREICDVVIVTAGGCKKAVLREMLPEDIEVTDTFPSLFTLKITDESLRSLMGTVVEDAGLSLAGTRHSSEGALLITDWGVSGPATLKLSSYAAPYLASVQYQGKLIVNWLNAGEDEIREWLDRTVKDCARKSLINVHPDKLTSRLWHHILQRCNLRDDMRWCELGGKGTSRLVNGLSCDSYSINGRARFKEEFVTCGGVSLTSVNPSTLESKKVPGLFFAGEVLDIDAITGGFNLQAAWSTAMVVAGAVCRLACQ